MQQFGEPITYFPRDGSAGDDGRLISAMVERQELEALSEAGDISIQGTIVRVRNDDTKGIASDEVDTGGDELSFARRVGETPQRRSIVRVLSDANGLLRLLCQ